MIKRDDYNCGVLDGMPVISVGDKQWIFARATSAWMPLDLDDRWNVVSPNWETYWKDLFADLPELPGAEQPPKPHVGNGIIIGGFQSAKPEKK